MKYLLMPVNFQQVYTRIEEIAQGAQDNKKVLEERRIKARELLALYASELDYLRQKVEAAKEVDSNIRCAVPLKESLAAVFPPPASVTDATIIAADGSQINPDRHAAIQFCVINVGVIAMKLRSGEAPRVTVETEILYGEDLMSNGSIIPDGMVAMRRDISERIRLDEVSKEHQRPDRQSHRWHARVVGCKRRRPASLCKFRGAIPGGTLTPALTRRGHSRLCGKTKRRPGDAPA